MEDKKNVICRFADESKLTMYEYNGKYNGQELITYQYLLDNGFVYDESIWSSDTYESYERSVNGYPYQVYINFEASNTMFNWFMNIDNAPDTEDSIGSLELSYIKQFEILHEIYSDTEFTNQITKDKLIVDGWEEVSDNTFTKTINGFKYYLMYFDNSNLVKYPWLLFIHYTISEKFETVARVEVGYFEQIEKFSEIYS